MSLFDALFGKTKKQAKNESSTKKDLNKNLQTSKGQKTVQDTKKALTKNIKGKN